MDDLAPLHRSMANPGASVASGHRKGEVVCKAQDEQGEKSMVDSSNGQYRYKAIAVFWEIGTEEEEAKEGAIDVDDEMWMKIFRGRPKPML